MLRHEMETARAGKLATLLLKWHFILPPTLTVPSSIRARVADARKPDTRFEAEDGGVKAFPDEVRQGSRASTWAAAVRLLAEDAHRVEAIFVRTRHPSNGTVRQDGEHLCRNIQLHARPEDWGELLFTTVCGLS